MRYLPARLLIMALILGGTAMSASALPEIDSLWDYDQPAVSEARFRSLLPEAGDEALDYQLQLKTQLARSLGLQRKFSAALTLLDEVSNHLPPEPCLARVRYLLERGRVYNSTGERERARPLFEQALKLASKMKADYYAVDAAHMLGIAAEPDQQLSWNLEALKMAEQSSDERTQKWLGSLYNNIGWTYHDRGEYAKALELFEKCLAWHSERKTGEGELIADWSVARTLRSLGRTEEALTRQQALLQLRQARQLPEDGYVSEEIGECLLALGKGAEAAPYFAKAWELLSADPWLKANEAKRLQRLKELGRH